MNSPSIFKNSGLFEVCGHFPTVKSNSHNAADPGDTKHGDHKRLKQKKNVKIYLGLVL